MATRIFLTSSLSGPLSSRQRCICQHCTSFSATTAHSHAGKANRAEKKSRKAIQKLGMKAVPGVTRITIKKSKNVRDTLRIFFSACQL